MTWLSEVSEETWIVSDTHFKHANINRHEPVRLEEMQKAGFDDPDEFLVSNWNSVVKEGELVIHLGDFSSKKGLDILNRLNGRIILLLGNHDIPMINKLKQFAQDYPEKLYIVIGVDGSDLHCKAEWASALIREFSGKIIMFSHYPLITDDEYMRGKALDTKQAMEEVYRREQCNLNIHGHVHSKDEHTDKSREINVSVERIDFKPRRLCNVIQSFI
ncbi:metallophosphoesterase family protein [Thiomicrorhabdus chilensis]|uniref:metallophosphoesterase family protein n=1 Tax=Thiomicrorhabdus chilensis TaxID=63656 RepID=UPI0009FE731C|nr:metallophosphoesterase family protein [Thiomicrorhabdus chilensis]